MSEINPRNFNADHAGLKHTIWSLDLQEEETIDLAMDRSAWKSVVASRHPRPGDTIQVRAHDDSRYWSLFVLGTGPGWLKASIIEQTRAEAVPELPEDCPLTTKWIVGNRTYDVIRRGDNTVLKGGFKMKPDAIAWIVEHLSSMSRAA